MLNELKTGSPQANAELRESLVSVLGRIAGNNMMDMLQETREHAVEASRERILDRLHNEAWKAATVWHRARERCADPDEANLILGIALALCAMLKWLADDGVYRMTYRHLLLQRDHEGYMMLVDETVVAPNLEVV